MFLKKKTTWTGISAIALAIGGLVSGEVDLAVGLTAIVGGIGLIFAGAKGAKAGVVLLAVLLAGCGSTPSPADEAALVRDLTAAPKGPSSGGSAADSASTDLPFAPAVGWGGSSAASNALSARYSPTATNSGTGSLVTGFVQGVTAEQRQQIEQAVHKAVKEDPVLASLESEMAALAQQNLADPAVQERLDEVRAQYSAARESLFAGLESTGVTERLDLGNLSQLVVVGVITSNVGHTDRPPTPEEAANLARVLSNPISAARGETVILGSGEKVEGAGE